MKQLHDNLFVAGQILRRDIPQLAEAGVTMIINNRPDNEQSDQLNHEDAAAIAEEHGIAYHYLPMENGKPLPQTLVADFKQLIEQESGPILAHCRSGMRSSFIWALGQVAQGSVTVDEAIKAANSAGIPLENAKSALLSVAPESD